MVPARMVGHLEGAASGRVAACPYLQGVASWLERRLDCIVELDGADGLAIDRDLPASIAADAAQKPSITPTDFRSCLHHGVRPTATGDGVSRDRMAQQL
jgi:hypothetical protein